MRPDPLVVQRVPHRRGLRAKRPRRRGVALPAAYEDAHALAARIEAALAVNPAPLTTCHNDLLNANFLRDGDHTWIVDYEYAGMGDPFFDLGNLAVNNDLDAEADELLLAPCVRRGA